MDFLNVRPLAADLSFGARMSGVSWHALENEVVRHQIRDVFEERGMIVFENMEPTSQMQVALSTVFGPLKDHPTKSTPRDSETGDAVPGVIDMHHVPSDDPDNVKGVVEVDGKRVVRFSPWHFDHCYNDELNRAGVLRAPITAPVGGRTGFMDGIELYDQFPRHLRDKIEGLNIIYTLDTRLSKMRFGVDFTLVGDTRLPKDMLKEVASFPRAMHPAVWTRKTGEKVMHIGPWMSVGVEHHENLEGDELYDEVCHEINRLGKGTSAYWHSWKPTDMVIWDNWRMLHAVEGCDAKYERQTLRTTIRGDYGLGYFEDGKKIGEVNREIA